MQKTPEGLLSRREAEVLAQVMLGKTNKAIGEGLFVTEKTVKFHLTNVYKKLGVKHRSEAIHKFFTNQLPEEPLQLIKLYMPEDKSTPVKRECPVLSQVTEGIKANILPAGAGVQSFAQ